MPGRHWRRSCEWKRHWRRSCEWKRHWRRFCEWKRHWRRFCVWRRHLRPFCIPIGTVLAAVCALLAAAPVVAAPAGAVAGPAVDVSAPAASGDGQSPQSAGQLLFVRHDSGGFTTARHGDALSLTLPGAGQVGRLKAALPSGITNLTSFIGSAIITLAPGAQADVSQTNRTIIVRITTPAAMPVLTAQVSPAAPPPPTVAAIMVPPTPARPEPSGSEPSRSDPSRPEPARADTTPPPPSPQQPQQPQQPQALGAVRLADATLGGPAFLLPYGIEVGAAAYLRGGVAYLIFDQPDPIDLSPLRDDRFFGSATKISLRSATLIDIPVPPGHMLRLVRRPDGWVCVLSEQTSLSEPITATTRDGAMHLLTSDANAIVVVPDRLTGAQLLIGTQRGDAQNIAAPRHMADFTLLRTALGVAVQPFADRVALTTGRGGFTIASTGAVPLALVDGDSGSTLLPGSAMTRRFDLPDLPVAALRARAAITLAEVAGTPALARAGARTRQALGLLALGLGHDALAVLDIATSEDPTLAADPQTPALQAIAAWLAGRPQTATPFAAASLGHTDDIDFWRAITTPDRDTTAADSAIADATHASQAALTGTLAQLWPLALTYPQALRARLLPAIVDRLAPGPLAALVAAADQFAHANNQPPPSNLAYARARVAMLAADHAPTGAPAPGNAANNAANNAASNATADVRLGAAIYGPDRRDAARARLAKVLRDHAQGRLNTAAAAAALDATLFAWRGDETELAARLALAGLAAENGAWRQALTALRQAEILYPQSLPKLRRAEHDVLVKLAAAGTAATISPFDLVALLDDNADLLAIDDTAQALAPLLLDRLMALDLPARARPIMARMLAAATGPAVRADLGNRLAQLALDQSNGPGALAMLAATEPANPAGMSTPQANARSLVRARANSSTGDFPAARQALANTTDTAALDMRAEMESDQQDFAAARQSLTQLLAAIVPPAGMIPKPAEDIVLRLAAATAQSRNKAALAALHREWAGRFSPGPHADLFAVITETTVATPTDLPRAATELAASRAASANLGADLVRAH